MGQMMTILSGIRCRKTGRETGLSARTAESGQRVVELISLKRPQYLRSQIEGYISWIGILVRSMAPDTAARMAALIFATSLCASFGHLAIIHLLHYFCVLSRLRSPLVVVFFSPIVINCCDFTGNSRQRLCSPLG